MTYYFTNINQIVELQIPATNNDNLLVANGASVTVTIPTGLSIYSASVTKGSFNTSTKIWTIGTIDPKNTEVLVLKVRIDNTDVLPFTIKSVLSISSPTDSPLTNNTRYDVIKLQGSCDSNCDNCDPCNFKEPTLILADDIGGLIVDLSKNDIIDCTCCNKVFEIVGTPENIVVVSLSNTGILNYKFTDISKDGVLQYRVICQDCINGLDYTSDPATVTFAAMANLNFSVKSTQTGDYTQQSTYSYFRFDSAANNVTFTLLPVASWSIGKSITVVIVDSSNSNSTFIISTSSPSETFTDTGLQTFVTASNYTALSIVYIGSNKFDILYYS